MRPRCGRTSPETARSVVDWPLPFAPSSVTISPSRTLSDTPSSACRCPYETARASTSSSSAIRGAKIRVDDGRVGGDLAWATIGDLSPVVQHHHAVGEPHDEIHVVLDDDQRQPQLVAQAGDDVDERACLAG